MSTNHSFIRMFAVLAFAVSIGLSAVSADAQSSGGRTVSEPGLTKGGSAPAVAAVNAAAPSVFTLTPSTLVVPVTVNDISSVGVFAFQFNILYDPAVVHPSGTNFGCSTTGTLAETAGLSPTCNVLPTGTLRVAVSGVSAMTGSGTILKVTFATNPAATPGSVSPLAFQDAFFFNRTGQVTNSTANGNITIVAPTAAQVSLGGRIVTADGTGIRNVAVTVAGGSLAQPVRTITGPFGYYRIDGLEAGNTYIVSVTAKQFSFAEPTRIITLSDSIADADFVADP